MRYFVLKQDESITDAPYPIDFFDKIDVRNVNSDMGDAVPYRTLIQLRPSEHTLFPEVLTSPVLLLAKEAQTVIRLYDERIEYRQIVYLNREHNRMQLYFMPLLDLVDCLSPSSTYVNAGKAALDKVVLKAEPIQFKTLFLLRNPKQRVIIARLDLVESLLARSCAGFTLEEAEIEY